MHRGINKTSGGIGEMDASMKDMIKSQKGVSKNSYPLNTLANRSRNNFLITRCFVRHESLSLN